MLKASSDTTVVDHREIIHSILCPLRRRLKSQPFELNNSTIELHVPSRRKKSLQSYWSVDFDFLALMRFDMTFYVMLHDDSSFGVIFTFTGSV